MGAEWSRARSCSECLSQSNQCQSYSRFYSSQWIASPGGDLGVTQSFEIGELKALALLLGEVDENGPHLLHHGVALRLIGDVDGRRKDHVVDGVVGLRRRSRSMARLRVTTTSHAPSEPRPGQMRRDCARAGGRSPASRPLPGRCHAAPGALLNTQVRCNAGRSVSIAFSSRCPIRVNIAVSLTDPVAVSLFDVRLSEGFGLEGDQNIHRMPGHHTQRDSGMSLGKTHGALHGMGCRQHEVTA